MGDYLDDHYNTGTFAGTTATLEFGYPGGGEHHPEPSAIVPRKYDRTKRSTTTASAAEGTGTGGGRRSRSTSAACWYTTANRRRDDPWSSDSQSRAREVAGVAW